MALAPSSLLLFLVSSSVWVALSLPSPVAAADGQAGGEQCPPFSCGDVTISFPFGLIPEGAGQTNCVARIGFQVLCSNNIPYFGSSTYSPRILDIFYDNSSLLIADVHKLDDFHSSATELCHTPTNNSSSKFVPSFSISPVNQNMIFYDCVEPPAPAVRKSRGLVNTTCGNRTLVGVTKGPDVPGSYFLEGCSATVVPMLARPGEVNPANYTEFISGGFLLTWQLPPSPSPAGKFAIGIKNYYYSIERIAIIGHWSKSCPTHHNSTRT